VAIDSVIMFREARKKIYTRVQINDIKRKVISWTKKNLYFLLCTTKKIDFLEEIFCSHLRAIGLLPSHTNVTGKNFTKKKNFALPKTFISFLRADFFENFFTYFFRQNQF